MSDDAKTPADRALDLFVFAPVGLALSARELLPRLAERGRKQLDSQVTVARMMGQFAVQQGQVEAEKAFVKARAQAAVALEQLGTLRGGEQVAPAGAPGPTPSTAPAPTPSGNGSSATTSAAAPAAPPPPAPPTSGPAAAALAIPDYDSLSAAQVVPRLSALTDEELEAVRVYELAHRGRKTILNKVAQLQAG